MSEHPILFSGPMVQAILAGRKTQTRRVFKPNKAWICSPWKVGDRLWVRETWSPMGYEGIRPLDIPRDTRILYRSDATGAAWKPSIHMPRWASRITLEITDLRDERLQDISPMDVLAEGVQTDHSRCTTPDIHPAEYFDKTTLAVFVDLWDSIYAASGYGFDENPRVLAVSFMRLTA